MVRRPQRQGAAGVTDLAIGVSEEKSRRCAFVIAQEGLLVSADIHIKSFKYSVVAMKEEGRTEAAWRG